jgi:signal transduction histidine kinase
MLPARHYFGAVFLTQTDAPGLQMLVNREGFVPNQNHEILGGLIRTGIDLSTRVRAATSELHRASRREDRKRPQVTDKPEGSTIVSAEAAFRGSVAAVEDLARGAREKIAEGDLPSAAERVEALTTSMHNLRAEADALLEERTMIRVLASVGLHRAAFIHEIRGLLGMAEAVESGLTSLRSDSSMSAAVRRRISEVLQSAVDLRRGLERQAAYLTDIIAPDARRRRSRVLLRDRFNAAARLVRLAAERADVQIENAIPDTVRLARPMFPAEIVVIFSNLLTNAVKAASPGGRVIAEGWTEKNRSIAVRISNTGTGVRPEMGERWFRPFESTTTEVDSVLGQGMGLGLPITRALLEEYGAQIQFVNPPSGFATAVQITFPAEI